MKPVKANWRVVGVTLCGVWLGMTGVAAGPPDISPSNPTVSVGQSVQFTLNGAILPTGVSAGGEYTCVRLSDATMQCTGRNQFGQLGDGTQNNTSTLAPTPGLAGVSAAVAGDEFNCALMVDGMPQLTAESFRCLVGHPRLEELWLYTPRVKVREAVERMLPGITRR